MMAGRARAGWANAANIAVNSPAQNPLLTLGFLSFCFYVFAFNSRILDLVFPRIHLPGISFALAIICAVLSGRMIEVLQHRIAIFLVGLSSWLVIAVPGSSWRGGSLAMLKDNWMPTMILFLVGGAVITTQKQCRRSLYVFGLAAAAGAVFVVSHGNMIHGRLLLEKGSFANSNTIAIKLLLGMPMLWLLAARSNAGMTRKILVGGALTIMLVALFLTGSRGGLIGLAVLVLIAFVRSPPLGKVKIAFAVAVLAAGAALFLPRSVKARFATIFASSMQYVGDDDVQSLMESAASSSQSRLELLLESVKLTAQHPLLGVGPGQFATYSAGQAAAQGKFSAWVGTHNTYTQLSSESGIPALCLYVATLLASMWELQRIYRRARLVPGEQAHDIAIMALALHSSFVAFCICGLFNHMAYEMTMPLMAAITIAISRTTLDELSRLEAAEMKNRAAMASPSRFWPIGAHRKGRPTGPKHSH
jgi:O-antigen ligase